MIVARHTQSEFRSHRRFVILGGCLIFAIVVAVALIIDELRKSEIAAFATATSNLGRGMAQQTGAWMVSVELALKDVQSKVASASETQPMRTGAALTRPEIAESLKTRQTVLPGVDWLAVVDPGGTIVIAAPSGQPSPVNISDRDFFRHFQNGTETGTFLGAPTRDPATGKWVAFMARPLRGDRGGFAGLVVAELSLAHLEEFYQLAMPPQRSVAVLRSDGTLIVRYPHQEDQIGRRIADGAPWFAIVAAGGGVYRSPGYFDPTPVIAAVRPLKDLPVVVEAAVRETDALAGWYRERVWIALGGVAGCIAVALLFRFLARQFRRLETSEKSLAEGHLELQTLTGELERSRDNLEAQVASRTADLASSEARLVDAIETLPEAFAVFDAQDRLVVCNAAFREMSEWNRIHAKPGIGFEELARAAIEDDGRALLGISGAEWARQLLDLHRSVGSEAVRSELQSPDGRWYEYLERRMRDGGHVNMYVDVTEARRRLAALAERDKLTALGQLAGGVAHEINNLLQPALVFPEMVREGLTADQSELCEFLDIITDSTRKARDVVKNVLLFARKDKGDGQEGTPLEPANLADEIGKAVKFLRSLLPPAISLKEEIRSTGRRASINKTELTQILTNLVVNASHASGGEGSIEIATGETRLSPGRAEELGLAPENDYLTVSVTDHGSGMDAATQVRIFEPFFTTKPVGLGTGLGLSVVLGILRSWHGAIVVESQLGTGTTFTLYIPALAEIGIDDTEAPAAPRAAVG
jgi:signal transduction histidine kinase